VAAPIVQEKAVSTGPALQADPVIWTARLRTGHVVIFQASDSRAFRAAALIASVAGEDSAVTAVAAAGDLADLAVIALAAAGDLEAVALGALVAAVAGSGADAEN
jgi:hypothetical protein